MTIVHTFQNNDHCARNLTTDFDEEQQTRQSRDRFYKTWLICKSCALVVSWPDHIISFGKLTNRSVRDSHMFIYVDPNIKSVHMPQVRQLLHSRAQTYKMSNLEINKIIQVHLCRDFSRKCLPAPGFEPKSYSWAGN